jgi:hypothetical protein
MRYYCVRTKDEGEPNEAAAELEAEVKGQR